MDIEGLERVFVDLRLAGFQRALDTRSRLVVILTRVKIDLGCRRQCLDLLCVGGIATAQALLDVAVLVDHEDEVGDRANQSAQIVQGCAGAKDILDAVRQYCEANRLVQEICRTETVGAPDRVFVLAPGDNEDGCFPEGFLGPDSLAYGEAVEVGHFDVEQHDVRLSFGKQVQRNRAGLGSFHAKAGLFQDVADDPAVSTVVIGDEDERFVVSFSCLVHVCAASSKARVPGTDQNLFS